jgi:hypothetical protein
MAIHTLSSERTVDQLASGVYAVDELVKPEWCVELLERVVALQTWEVAKVAYRELGAAATRYEPAARQCDKLILNERTASEIPFLAEYFSIFSSWVLPFVNERFDTEIASFGDSNILRYPIGGFFAPHVDNGPLSEHRAFTTVLYLNEGFSGGATLFPEKCCACPPKTGRLVVFPSYTLHAGEPVLFGEKFAILTWLFYPKAIY